MRAFYVLGDVVGLALLTVLSSCESSGTSTPSTPSAADADADAATDASAVDASAPADDATADARDCTLADADRTDAGRPRMTFDRTKVGEICWTLEAGTIGRCPADEFCSLYNLPEDPPSTARCGRGCEPITCPGQYTCAVGFSYPGAPNCTCD
jgi:hypothetical protein